MEQTKKSVSIDDSRSVINETSNRRSQDIVDNCLDHELKKKPQKRHVITVENGFGVCKILPVKVEKKDETLTASKKSRKIYVLPEHIELISKEPPLYKCSICKRSFKNKLHSKYHEPCLTGHRPLVCSICDRGFITKGHFAYHLRIHSDVKPFSCRYCSKKFAQKAKLKRHIRTKHLNERPHACNVCPKQFTSKQALDMHMRWHLRVRPFRCDLCLRTFSSKFILKRHRLMHSGVRNFSCETCDKKFKLKCDLTVHQRVHTGIRPYQCSFTGCTKSFNLKNSLNRHLQTHSDLRDYECSICVTAFRRKDNLERHMKTFHPESMVDGHPRQIVSIVQPKNPGFKKKSRSNVSSTVKGSVNSKYTGGLLKGADTDTGNHNSDESQVNREHLERSAHVEHAGNSLETDSWGRKLGSISSVIVEASDMPVKGPSLSEEVSVIKKSTNSFSDDEKLKQKQSNGIHCKKSESIVPYRTITPSLKLSDNDKMNCVPTITKVTHIVHTSKTGIPNIQTVITTEDVTKNRTKQSRDNNSDSSNRIAKEISDVAEKQKRSKSVIKYASRKIEKTRTSVDCYRLLKPSSEFVTTCSYLGNGLAFPDGVTDALMNESNLGVFDGRKEQLYSHGSFANAFENLCQELLSEDTNTRGDTFNPQIVRSKIMDSRELNRTVLQNPIEPANTRFYNASFSDRLPPYSGVVSDSCLLADNALDHHLTDSLYEEQENNMSSYNINQLQNASYGSESNCTFNPISYRPSHLDHQQHLYNYSHPAPTHYSSYDCRQDGNYNLEQSYLDENGPKAPNYVDEQILHDWRSNYDCMASKTKNSPPARSVIIDHSRVPNVPSMTRQLPLKKCLWMKSAFSTKPTDAYPEVI